MIGRAPRHSSLCLKTLLLRTRGAGGQKCKHGSLKPNSRKRGLDVWQFPWSENSPDSKFLYRNRIVGTVVQYSDEAAARSAVVGVVSEINADGRSTNSRVMTVAQLCDHFEQRELTKENTWGSYATKTIYKAYLTRWVRPHWRTFELAEVRTIKVDQILDLPAPTSRFWISKRHPGRAGELSKWRPREAMLRNHRIRARGVRVSGDKCSQISLLTDR